MEKEWDYSEREAEKRIFHALIESSKAIPGRGRTFMDLVNEFRIDDPSELIEVEYLRSGAFLRYAMMRGKEGSTLGQYKPPKIIPSDRIEIYEKLRNA
jgi:hypothetical protein